MNELYEHIKDVCVIQCSRCKFNECSDKMDAADASEHWYEEGE